jgi:hypothetical protein
MEGQTTQWPFKRRVNGRTDNTMAFKKSVNGRTDNTMAIRKKGKWKDRQRKPSERRVNGRTDNTMIIRKKDNQHNGHQKEG